jgi:hypothetical protein
VTQLEQFVEDISQVMQRESQFRDCLRAGADS